MSDSSSATSPPPLPTSRTRMPGRTPASTTKRRVAGSAVRAWRSSRSSSPWEWPRTYGASSLTARSMPAPSAAALVEELLQLVDPGTVHVPRPRRRVDRDASWTLRQPAEVEPGDRLDQVAVLLVDDDRAVACGRVQRVGDQ